MEDQDVSPVSFFAREHVREVEVEAQLFIEGCTDDAIEQQLTNSRTSSDGKGAREPLQLHFESWLFKGRNYTRMSFGGPHRRRNLPIPS
jgi:hypothetical protein